MTSLKEIFANILSLKNMVIKISGGLAVAFLSLTYVPPGKIVVKNNVFYDIISSVPVVFCYSLIFGFIWTNAALNGKITHRKLLFLFPFALIWLAVLFLSV